MHDNKNLSYLALGIIVVAVFHPVTELCVSNVSQMVFILFSHRDTCDTRGDNKILRHCFRAMACKTKILLFALFVANMCFVLDCNHKLFVSCTYNCNCVVLLQSQFQFTFYHFSGLYCNTAC